MSNFVSVLEGGCVGVFFLTDQRTNQPTDQQIKKLCALCVLCGK